MPVATWSAPGRVNLIGEHTDYNGGLALPFAIELRTTATVRPRGDDTLVLRSRQHPGDVVDVDLARVGRGVPGGWASYVAGVFAVLRSRGFEVAGADVDVDGAVPAGAGLSSSASVECAVAAAANDAFGLHIAGEELARVAQQAENDVVGVPCGAMDQLTAMLAHSGHALLLDFSAPGLIQVPVPTGRTIVVVDTLVRHDLADGHYAKRRQRCADAAAALGVASLSDAGGIDDVADLPAELRGVGRHVVTENLRVRAAVGALRDADWPRLGHLLVASHVSLRDDYRVSCPELDLAVTAMVDAGADGARLTGGGFGGSVIGIVAPDVDVATAVHSAFDDAGFAPPVVRVVTPAEGARREARHLAAGR